MCVDLIVFWSFENSSGTTALRIMNNFNQNIVRLIFYNVFLFLFASNLCTYLTLLCMKRLLCLSNYYWNLLWPTSYINMCVYRKCTCLNLWTYSQLKLAIESYLKIRHDGFCFSMNYFGCQTNDWISKLNLATNWLFLILFRSFRFGTRIFFESNC